MACGSALSRGCPGPYAGEGLIDVRRSTCPDGALTPTPVENPMSAPGTIAAKKTPSQVVLEYAKTKLGHKVGRGKCWDLPFEALRHANAKTPHELGRGLYFWGQKIDRLEDAQPGDILQFEKVHIKSEWVEGNTKHWATWDFPDKHSAIVETVNGGMWFTVLNAHIKNNPKVTRLRMNLSPENIQSGTIEVYRPIEK